MSDATEYPKSGKFYVTEPDARRPLHMTETGPGSIPPTTLCAALKERAESMPNRVALNCKYGGETYQKITWGEYRNHVIAAAKSLLKIGVDPHHGVGLIGFNSPEWFYGAVAAVHVGAISAGIYTTNKPDACHYVVDHCSAQVVFVEDTKQLAKFLEIWDTLPKLKAIVQYSGKVEEPRDNVYDWEQFIKLGEDVDEKLVDERVAAQSPENCMALIYTSGTTGPPKAVMMSHDNMTWTARVVAEQWIGLGPRDRVISYLPLSHVAAYMIDIVAPIVSGAQVFFARPDALRGTLGDTLKEVRPTVFIGVPRVWEKIMEKMLAIGREAGGLTKAIGGWAKKLGLAANYDDQKGKGKWRFGLNIANALVFSTVREKLGFDHCHFQCTAAAPTPLEVHEYFMSLDLPLYEIYGASETAGPVVVSHPTKYKTGAAGPPFPGSELVIADPDKNGDGEILARGRNIMMGYLHNPKASAETINEEGYYRSGDVGRVDENGFLHITGRIKELIITAGGENVAPVLIEDNIKEAHAISNVVVIGDKRKYLTCLVTLKVDTDEEGNPSNKLTKDAREELARHGATCTTTEEAQDDPVVAEYLKAALTHANGKAVSRASNVQKFKLLTHDFSVNGNELTPTLKLKRRIVYDKYADQIESLYK